MTQSNRAQLQKACDLWNGRNPIGTPVEYQKVKGGEWLPSVTNSEAYVLGGHTAVIFLLGVSGCTALDFVRLRTLTPIKRAD